MLEGDVRIRREVYRQFVDTGLAPTVATLAPALGLTESAAADSLRRLDEVHEIVLEPGTLTIRKLLPFAMEPTAHRVEAAGRSWYANCAWDAFGVVAAFKTDGTIHSSCPCCADVIELEVRDAVVSPATDVSHLLVPADRWWDDIFFT